MCIRDRDIVDPPKQPEPDPEPETTPPEASEPESAPPVTSDPPPGQPGNSGTDHESDGDGATSSTGSSGGSHGDGKEPTHGITQKSDLPGGSLDYEAAPPITVPESTSCLLYTSRCV